MVNDAGWDDFCALYFDVARERARMELRTQKKKLGSLDRHVDEDYVVDEATLCALEKTYKHFDSSRGVKLTTLLSRIVHNELVDALTRENKAGAKKSNVEDAENVLFEHLRAQALEVRREDLVPKLSEAIGRLSVSDRYIIECYLEDKRTFTKEASEKLGISENYVSVRKSRIIQALPKLMESTRKDYYAWLQSIEGEVFAGLERTKAASVDGNTSASLRQSSSQDDALVSLAEKLLEMFH